MTCYAGRYFGVIKRVCTTNHTRPNHPPGPPGPPGPPSPHNECADGEPLPAACEEVMEKLCPRGDQGNSTTKACRDCVKSRRTDPRATAVCPHKEVKAGAQLCYTVTAEFCGNGSSVDA